MKPFSPRELVSRVKAILRRVRGQMTETPGGRNGLWIDPAAKQAFFDERLLDLTPSEYRIIAALTSRPGLVLSREQLLDVLYPQGEGGTLKSVDIHIHNSRS